MDQSSMESYLIGRKDPPKEQSGRRRKTSAHGILETVVIFALAAAVAYLLYDGYRFKEASRAEMTRMADQIQALENIAKERGVTLTGLNQELSQTKKAVGSTKADLIRTTREIQAEGAKTKDELSQALATKADSTDVTAVRQETAVKFGEVTTQVGGVKTDLESTRRDLEGTQRQLIDVKDTLSAAVAKNASELDVLRRKGERDYYEFTIKKKNLLTKVEDIRLILKKTDVKKGKYTIQIIVDDSRLEKKDRTINEPIQFLVGRNRVRYELVVNWVQKNQAGGYLSIPKDRTLSAERRNP